MTMLWSIYKLILLYYVYTLPYMPKYVFKLLAHENAHLRATIFAVFARPERPRYKKLFFSILTLPDVKNVKFTNLKLS